MGYSIRTPNGIISMVDVNFKCPKCECLHYEGDYYDKLYNSKNGLIYKQCKVCKSKLGISTDIRGDVHVWLKKDERKVAYKGFGLGEVAEPETK
jgi:hypothetical protein